MDFSTSNGPNGGLFQGNLQHMSQQQQQHQQQQQQQQRQLGQQHSSCNMLSGGNNGKMPSDDYQQMMMANIGSVMPSRTSIASFMHRPQDMLCLGSSTNAIFEPAQALKNSNSSAFLQNNQLQQQLQQQPPMFFNQNALFQQQQQQQQLLAKVPQQKQQEQPEFKNNGNSAYQNAMFQQQRQQLQQQHELQRQQLKQQQAQRLKQHEQEQLKKRANPGNVVSNSSQQQPRSSSFQEQQHRQQHLLQQQQLLQQASTTNNVMKPMKPQRTMSAPIPPTTTKPLSATFDTDSNCVDEDDPFDFPGHFTDDIDDYLFGDFQPISLSDKKRKEPTPSPLKPVRSVSMPSDVQSSTASTSVRVSISPPSTRPPLAAASSGATSAPSTSMILPPVVEKSMQPLAPSLLHQACYLYPTTLAVVNSALGVEKDNVRRRVPTPAAPVAVHSNDGNKRRKYESFSLPLHIALDKDGSKDVVEVLAKAGPDVIAMPDGPDACSAISVALYKNCEPDTIIMLAKANPGALKVLDRHQNTALHVGCSKGASLGVMQLLHETYPDAVSLRNFHGQSPLDVAQRTTVCPLDVIDFLQSLEIASFERRASHLVDSEDDGLV